MAISRDPIGDAFAKIKQEALDMAQREMQEFKRQADIAKAQQNVAFPWQQGLAGMAQQNRGGSFQSAMSQLANAYAPTKLLPSETMVHAIVGWRRWSIGMFDNVLKSNNETPWKPYEKLAATCMTAVGNCRGVDCSCGIYAYKDRADAEHGENAPSAVTHIWGEVWLWGRVIECQRGFRAQFAYPKAFVGQRGSITQQVAEAYGAKLIAEDK